MEVCSLLFVFFFFQAEDGIRDAQESRGLGDVYKRQIQINNGVLPPDDIDHLGNRRVKTVGELIQNKLRVCLLYTSDAADDLLCVDLGGRRIIKKKKSPNKYQH